MGAREPGEGLHLPSMAEVEQSVRSEGGQLYRLGYGRWLDRGLLWALGEFDHEVRKGVREIEADCVLGSGDEAFCQSARGCYRVDYIHDAI